MEVLINMLNQFVYILLVGWHFIYLCEKNWENNSFLMWNAEQKAAASLYYNAQQ